MKNRLLSTSCAFILFVGVPLLGAGALEAQTLVPSRPNDAQSQAFRKVQTQAQTAQIQAQNQVQQVQGINQNQLLPQTSIDQAKDQFEGIFPNMARTLAGGLIQEAWDKSANGDGVVRFSQCRDCVYKVRLREFMTTTIELPENAVITAIDLGDGEAFAVRQRMPHIVAIKPTGYGMDSNLTLYTQSGDIYPFYLRAEAHNSQNIPDLLVRIGGADIKGVAINILPPPMKPAALNQMAAAPDPVLDEIAQHQADLMKAVIADFGAHQQEATSMDQAQDYVKRVDFDPATLKGFDDYTLWGNKSGRKMKPDRIFRDDHFTYIQFGDAWDKVDLPVAYVVVDKIDELVNTRITGRTYIIESTHDLITLKSGQSYLCIQYEGDS